MANIRIFFTSWESKLYSYSLYMHTIENLANYELNFYELKPTGVLYGDRQDETYLKDNVLAVDYKLTNTKYSSQNRIKIQINDYDLSDPNLGDNYYKFFYKDILPLPLLNPIDPYNSHRYLYLLERRPNCYSGQDLENNELYISFFDVQFADNLFSKYKFSSPLYDSGSHLRFAPFPTHFTHAFIVHIDDVLSNDFRGRLFVYDGTDLATPPSGANFYGFKTLTPQVVGSDVWQDIGGLANNLEFNSSGIWTEFSDITQLNLLDNNCNYVSSGVLRFELEIL